MTQTHRQALPKGYMLHEYQLDRVLGSGGFGLTYLAWDTGLDKPVAIKEYLPNDLAVRETDHSVMPKSDSDEDNFQWGLERFLDEARTLARFKHPNIIAVHRYFETHNTAYIVMEFAEGETLDEVLKRGVLEEPRLLSVLMPLLDGLEEVHRGDFLHRDIKPGNIVIRPDGSPVLLDFGSARQAIGSRSRSITSVVTPGYAPIEQYSARGNQGPWTDIYALGAVAYKAICGETPPDATGRLRQDPMRPVSEVCRGKYSGPLLNSIDWALSVEEEARPQDVTSWRKLMTGEAQVPVREGSRESKQPERKRRTGLMAMMTGLLLVTVIGGGYLYLQQAISACQASYFAGNHQSVILACQTLAKVGVAEAVSVIVRSEARQEATEEAARLAKKRAEEEAARLARKKAEEEEAARLARKKAEEEMDSPSLKESPEISFDEFMGLLDTSAPDDISFDEFMDLLDKPATDDISLDEFMGMFDTPAEASRLARKKAEEEEASRLARKKVEEEDARRKKAEQQKAERLRAGKVFRDCADCPEMVVIPAGRFRMGDLNGDGYQSEKPVHAVRIAQPFALGRYEVTFAEYDRYAQATGKNKPGDTWDSGRGNRPVINVNWEDAQGYAKWLSRETGQRYRLPSEAEWEYAARAGSTTKYSWGNSPSGRHANANEDWGWPSDGYEKTAPTGSFIPNQFGLYDMSGNVWEWVEDCWHENYARAPMDGSAWVRGGYCDLRGARGGSSYDGPAGVRSASRSGSGAADRYSSLGFRLVRTL